MEIQTPIQPQTIQPAKDGNYYFAYVRKSSAGTKKQVTSLFEQHSDIKMLAKKLNISIGEINFYEESRSAFKVNENRPELQRMQKDIESVKNKSGEKILLSSIISRLARHRVVGDYFVEALLPQDRRIKPLLNKIYNSGKIWDNNSKGIDLQNAFDIASNESEEKRDFQFKRRTSYLESGRYRMITPLGFIKVSETQGILTEDPEKMPHIKRAFEMAIEGKKKYEIADYLFENRIRTHHGNPIHTHDLYDRIFSKTIYKGEFTDTNGDFYDNFDFKSGKPPISKMIWQQAHDIMKPGKQHEKGKRKYQRSKDTGDIITKIGRTESGFLLSRDVKIKKYKNGKTAEFVYYVNKVEKINISKKVILEAFIEKFFGIIAFLVKYYMIFGKQKYLSHIIKLKEEKGFTTARQYLKNHLDWVEKLVGTLYTEKYYKDIKKMYENAEFEKYLDSKKQEIEVEIEDLINTKITKDNINDFILHIYEYFDYLKPQDYIKRLKDGGFEDALTPNFLGIIEENSSFNVTMLEYIKDFIKQINPQEEKQQEIFKKQIEINNIEIENLKGQNKKITQKMLIMETEDEETLQIAEETKAQNKNRIAQLEKENDILQNKGSLKKFLKRLPDILYRIFELASKYDGQAEIEDFESDLYDLIRFTLSNLTISNKKSLKIGISGVLEMLFFNEKYDWQPFQSMGRTFSPLQKFIKTCLDNREIFEKVNKTLQKI